MTTRLRRLGIVLAVVGLVFAAGGAYAFIKVQEGYRSLNAFSAAQNVTLTYNETASSSTAARSRARRPSWRMLTERLGLPGRRRRARPE